MILVNAFSLNMFRITTPLAITVTPITKDTARTLLAEGFTSAIGHESTAAVVGEMLDMSIPTHRLTLSFSEEDAPEFVVAQYTGPRLPEGATTLPEGATMTFYTVTVAHSK